MKVKLRLVAAVCFYCATAGLVWGQDLDPQIRKIKDGVYVYVGKNFNSNAGIILASAQSTAGSAGGPGSSNTIPILKRASGGVRKMLPWSHSSAG